MNYIKDGEEFRILSNIQPSSIHEAKNNDETKFFIPKELKVVEPSMALASTI